MGSSRPIDKVFDNLALSTQDVANENRITQEPIFEAAPSCKGECDSQPVYFLTPSSPSAEAVVTSVGDEIRFWMGGISSRSLEAFTPGAVFYLLAADGQVIGEIEKTSRQGLTGVGKVIGDISQPISEGMFLRERIRGVPPIRCYELAWILR